MKNMIHGPCADWCMVDGKCSKHFPKEFQNETNINENGYPSYKRENTGITYEKSGGYKVDNRHVVPYSPNLLALFNCHMNVEIVSSIKSVKYIYKYIYKGHDAATASWPVIQQDNRSESILEHDEIKDYVDTRYVSPVEALWRILSKPLQEKSHSITRLPVHLPNEHNVVLQDISDVKKLLASLNQVTMLMDYFNLNARDEDAKRYVYSEIPKYYVFKKDTKLEKSVPRWQPRQTRFNCIGRMYSVSPAQTELFHLRILLLHVKGATSFDNLKTVEGKLHKTFAEACLTLGLIENDQEWSRAMSEATIWMMPNQLRCLFVRLLIHCQPVDPYKLWEDFKDPLSEDYLRNHELLQSHKMAYDRIQIMLKDQNYKNFHIAHLDVMESLLDTNNHMTSQQYIHIGLQQYDMLNTQQKEIVDTIMNAVDNCNTNDKNCFFIDGPGGSGKTFIYKTLYYLIKGRTKEVNTMAFTGIAATLLPEGKTVHKTLGLPVPLFSDSSSNIKSQTEEGQLLKNTDVFIWDEAPMAPKYALKIMNRALKHIMQNDLLFGGKIVVLGGDFRLLTVI